MVNLEVDVKIEGAERFADRLDEVYDRVVDRTGEELEAAKQTVLNAARGFAPVDTGRYRDSLRGRVKGRIAQVWTDNPYAGVVEFAREYTRDPDGREAHSVDWGNDLASPPRVIYRALDNNVTGISDDFFDAMVDEFEAGGWLEE